MILDSGLLFWATLYTRGVSVTVILNRISRSRFGSDASAKQRLCAQCNRDRRPDEQRSFGRHRFRLADLRQDCVDRAPRVSASLETVVDVVVVVVVVIVVRLRTRWTDLRGADRAAVPRDRPPGVRVHPRQSRRRARTLFPVVQPDRMVGRALRKRPAALRLLSQSG